MAISCIYTVSRDDAEARNWLRFLRRHGYGALSTLLIERVLWLEGAVNAQSLLPLVANPLYQTADEHSTLDLSAGPIVEIASSAFIGGGITMPICCLLMAHFPKAHMLFAVPVISLICAGILTVIVVSNPMTANFRAQSSPSIQQQSTPLPK